MAAAILSQREINIHSDRSAGTPISGDKEISESTLKQLARFLLNNNYELNYDTRMLRNLTITPLSADEVRFGIRLIHEHPLVTVVENELNKSESGGTLITMERTISVKEMHQFGVASYSGIALSNLEAGASIKIITVSKNALDALNNYKEKFLIARLKNCCEKVSRYVSSAFSGRREFIAKCCMFFCGAGFFSAIVVLGYNLIKNTRDIAEIDPE